MKEVSLVTRSCGFNRCGRKKSCFVVLTEKSISQENAAKRMKNLHLLVCVGQSPLQPMRYSFWSIAILLPLVLAASVEHRESKGGGAMSAWPNFFMSKVSLPLNFILMVNTAMREFQIRFTWDPGLSFWHRLHHPFGQLSLPEVGQGEGGRRSTSIDNDNN